LDTISYQPIGVIHSPFKEPAGMPIQSAAAGGILGSIELDPECSAGLKDIEGFSHLILIYHLHLMKNPGLTVVPFLDDTPHGVFATRSPKRPNPIGLSIVRLVGVRGTTLLVEEVDIVDGTPLLDIKPYVPQFDQRDDASIGWFAKNIAHLQTIRANIPQ
jgi:tRNA-Thr(GGU) m(6)t(6)A37 methyltransferase TsaA